MGCCFVRSYLFELFYYWIIVLNLNMKAILYPTNVFYSLAIQFRNKTFNWNFLFHSIHAKTFNKQLNKVETFSGDFAFTIMFYIIYFCWSIRRILFLIFIRNTFIEFIEMHPKKRRRNKMKIIQATAWVIW